MTGEHFIVLTTEKGKRITTKKITESCSSLQDLTVLFKSKKGEQNNKTRGEISHSAPGQLLWIMNTSLPAAEVSACQAFQILV